MGMDYSGGMIVGANAATVEDQVYFEDEDGRPLYGSNGEAYEEFYEWYEEVGMRTMSLRYDADSDNQILGFEVDDIEVLSEKFPAWLEDVKSKALKFKELTGIDAELIGTQNIW